MSFNSEHKSIVKRPSNIKVKFLNIEGLEEIIDAEGSYQRVFNMK